MMADAVSVLSRKLSVTDSLVYTFVVILPHRYRPQRPESIPATPVRPSHKRRIKTEEKVVAFVWGEEFIQILAALTVLPRTILKNRRIKFNLFFLISWCNLSYKLKSP